MEMHCQLSLDEPGLQRSEQHRSERLFDRLARESTPDVRALAELLEASPRVALDGGDRLAALADGLRILAMAELAHEVLEARSSDDRSLARAAFFSLARGTPRVAWATSAGALVKVSAGGRDPGRVARMMKRSVAAMMGVSAA